MWCYWRESSYHRRDHASVFQPHDDNGEPVASYWHAAPPWFGNPAEDAAVMRRRFKTPERAMEYADTNWPEGCHPPDD